MVEVRGVPSGHGGSPGGSSSSRMKSGEFQLVKEEVKGVQLIKEDVREVPVGQGRSQGGPSWSGRKSGGSELVTGGT